jgi:hypothetical protein
MPLISEKKCRSKKREAFTESERPRGHSQRALKDEVALPVTADDKDVIANLFETKVGIKSIFEKDVSPRGGDPT